jgi:diguanylate cyclase (GGDEF)-like protein
VVNVITSVLIILSVIAIVYAAMSQRASARARRQLQHLATHDPLTDLPNRIGLRDALDKLTHKRAATARGAVLLVELDRFASVNDTYGHDIGDQLMVAAARQLQRGLARDDLLFRAGGPQFVVICPSVLTIEGARQRATDLQQLVRVQYRIEHDHLRISSSVGIVLLDTRHTAAHIVLEDAEAALRDANDRGLGNTSVFEISMRGRVNAYDAEERMRTALENNDFLVVYLPVVSISTSRIVGVEALLRWVDPSRGLVSPGEFFALLEKTDVLAPVGEFIFREACRHNREWQERFPNHDLASTINVSPTQLTDPEFIPRLVRIIEETGADPARLCLEITEGSMRHGIEHIWFSLRTAKEAGLQLALDDFGTGYSSFDYIRKFTLDVLKIDRVFVERVADTKEDYAIVQQLVGLAHALDLVAIAEGVTNADQADTLTSLNCDLAQGYYWSEPQSADTITKLLERGTIRPGSAQQIDWKAPATSERLIQAKAGSRATTFPAPPPGP